VIPEDALLIGNQSILIPRKWNFTYLRAFRTDEYNSAFSMLAVRPLLSFFVPTIIAIFVASSPSALLAQYALNALIPASPPPLKLFQNSHPTDVPPTKEESERDVEGSFDWVEGRTATIKEWMPDIR
jgi:hypothetical protein